MSLTNKYPAGSGIIPDHTIVPTVQDIILKKDIVIGENPATDIRPSIRSLLRL